MTVRRSFWLTKPYALNVILNSVHIWECTHDITCAGPAMAVHVCFLCQRDLVTRTEKAKKLLVFEKAAAKYRETLDALSEEIFGRMLSEKDKRDSSYICHNCCNNLENWLKYLKKSEDKKNSILRNMEHLLNSETADISLDLALPEQQVCIIFEVVCVVLSNSL